MEVIITILLSLPGLYFLIGVLFAIVFIVKGIHVIDPSTKSSPVIFKILVFPGSIGLWPVLLLKWMRAK